MILKYRTIPDQLIKEIALSRRLPPGHRLQSAVQSSINTGKAGYKGEKEVDFYLELLSKDKFNIFQGLRLPREHYFFQMDNLVVTKQFMLIVEVKNIEGILYFDQQHNQFYRVNRKTNEKQKMTDPFKQVNRHRKQFLQWLIKYNFPLMPIECLVINSNEDTLFESNGETSNIFEKIIHAEYLLEKIYKLEQKYQKDHFQEKELKKLTKLLLKEDSPLFFDVRHHYKYHDSDLIKGVRCPECEAIPMTWNRRSWECAECHHRSKRAHKSAFHEYFLLLSPYITNQKCRDFLNCPSPDTTKLFLRSMKFKKTGSKRFTRYLLEGYKF